MSTYVGYNECGVCEQKRGHLHLWHCAYRNPNHYMDADGKETVVKGDTVNPKEGVAKLKLDTTLIPSAGIMHEATAFMDGARKYGPYNWRTTQVSAMVYLRALDRHFRAYLDGQDYDPETGVHHLGYIRANCGIILDGLELGIMVDDRPPPGPAAKLLQQFEQRGKLTECTPQATESKDTLISKLIVKLTSFAMEVDDDKSFCKICNTVTNFTNPTLRLPHAHKKTCTLSEGD